jgi:hypothetical protein
MSVMRKAIKPILAAMLAAAMTLITGPVMAQTNAPLTPDDRVLLNAINGCRAEPAPDYCAPFKGLLAHIQKSEASVPEAETKARLTVINAELDSTATAVSDLAAGQGPDHGVVVAPDGGKAFSFVGATDTKTASVSIDIDLPDKQDVLKNGTNRARKNTLTITAQTPVGQGSDYQNIATLDKMTKATSLGIAFNHYAIRWDSQAQTANDKDFQIRCVKIADELLAADPSQKVKLTSTYVPGGCNAGNLRAFIADDANLSTSRKAALAAAVEKLSTSTAPKIKSIWLFSVNGKVGQETHDYYDGTTLAKFSDSKKPWEIGVAATRVFSPGNRSTSLSYKHQLAYDDAGGGEKQTLCPPSGSPNLVCINGYVGAPKRTNTDLITLDYRYLSPKGRAGVPWGINPAATYDLESDKYGFQVPIYLILDSKKALTGGLRYDWTSDEHKSVVGIFITSAFCVLPGYSGCSAKDDSDK